VKKNTYGIILALLAVFVLRGTATPERTKLPEIYKKWLNEEVVYIIGSVEREVFLKLQTDRERDLFIEAFWKLRDPTPGTPENEFKNEHYRRINYANRYLGRETPRPGWMTDRGRIYIILGEPNDIQRYSNKSGLYDCEVWFYQGKTDLGLPPGFNLLFFREMNQGDYKLYSPTINGPQALLTNFSGDTSNYESAYQALKEIDPMLADVSFSLIPGESSGIYGRPSLVSDLMIQKVETVPQRMIDEKYAKKFLEYKDVVEVEYTANYMDSDSMVKILKDPSGLTFVHYIIEPKKLSVNNYENKYYTSLKLNGTVTTLDGKMVFQFDKAITLELDEAQMKERSRQPFEIFDVFPLIPGDYRMSVLLKNEVSKEFTSLEQTLRIPEKIQGIQISSPLLAYNVVPQESKKIKPFFLAGRQLYCQPGRIFAVRDTLSVGFQVFGLTDDLLNKGEIKFTIFKEDQIFREMTKKVSEYATLPDVFEAFPLDGFVPAHYKIRVSFMADGAEVVGTDEEFDITHMAGVPRPWTYARILPETGDPFYARVIGSQLYNLGRYEEAKNKLEPAYQIKPTPDTAGQLAMVYMAQKAYDKVDALTAPYLTQTPPPIFEFFWISGLANLQMRNFARALEIFDSAISHYGANEKILNAVGDCYLGLGKPGDARTVWEKSLSMNANQPEIKKKVDQLKSQKNP
jgi:GWxTD domain-containing protein